MKQDEQVTRQKHKASSPKYYAAYQIKEDEMGGAWDSSGEGQQCTEGCDGET